MDVPGSIFCESLKVHLYLGPIQIEGLVFGALIVYIEPLFVFELGSIGPFFYFGMVQKLQNSRKLIISRMFLTFLTAS